MILLCLLTLLILCVALGGFLFVVCDIIDNCALNSLQLASIVIDLL